MITRRNNGFDTVGFDGASFDETVVGSYDYLTPAIGSNYKRTTYGWGASGARVYLRPEIYVPINRQISQIISPIISITSASGAFSDTIRSDVKDPLIDNIEFTDGESGSADFTLRLHRMPPFPLIPFSLLICRIGPSDFDWYAGILNYPANGGNGPYSFSGKGLIQYLNSIEAETTFIAGPDVDITDVVREIAQTWIAPYSPIRYNENKVLASAGVPLTENIQTSKVPIGKVIQILADQAKCRWGVDGDRDFFFMIYEEDPTQIFFVGYDFHDYKPTDNMDEVYNYWLLTRNKQLGTDGTGWNVGGVFESAPSQKKYGFKKQTRSFPGYWGDDTFELVGENLLERYKDPKPAATASNWTVPATGMRHIDIGRCWVVEPPAKTWTIFDDLDDASDWTGPAVADPDVLMWSSDSIRVDHPGLESESGSESVEGTIAYLFKQLSFFGKITKVAFYARATRTGVLGTWGVGDSEWSEYTKQLEIFDAGVFVRQEIDLTVFEDGGIDRFRYFGFEIEDENALSFYADRLEVEIYGARWLNMQVTKVRYDAKMQASQVEFGTLPPSFPSFVRGLLAAQSDLQFGQEIR